MALTQERLKERLMYNPKSGLFTWLIGNDKAVKSGDNAGCLNAKGYVQIWLDGKNYTGHRLAWFYMYGEWPYMVDHRDRIKSNNKSCNLRATDPQGNQRNRGIGINNKSGILGVYWCKEIGKWAATIKVNGKSKNLGGFYKIEDAAQARYEAEIKYNFVGG